MPGLRTGILLALPLPIALIGLTACSSAPRGPQPGTPAFSWQSAKETFASKDYLKTADHLRQVVQSASEFAKPAKAMRLVLVAGLAKGYSDLAAVGAANDPAKAQAAFQSGRPQVPREVFLLAMANNLYDLAQLFGKKKLDLPQRVEFFVGEAKTL